MISPIKSIFNKNLTSISQLSNNDIFSIFELAKKIKDRKVQVNFENKKSIGLLFFQPSTRTRMSFEIAAKNIGLNTLLETNPEINSAMAKQETLHDILKTMSYYNDAIILRHPNENEVFDNIKNINVPIINAGWGNYEHPTQSLIDLYTFNNLFEQKKNNKIVKKDIAIVGDPNTRTSKSISELCSRFDFNISFIYPSIFKPEKFVNNFKKYKCDDSNEFKKISKKFDILYYSNFTGTEIDFDRNKIYDTYFLDYSFLNDNKIHVYSPLPRRPNEIDVKSDNTPHNLSFIGVENSVFLRMALLNNIIV